MRIVSVVLLFGIGTVSAADIERYRGICEPSAGAFISSTRFAVASDESNVLRLYERGSPIIMHSVDLRDFTGYDKSDLEAAAPGNGTIYWTASQSNSSGGKDKKRKVLFKTDVVVKDGITTIQPVGIVREDLKEQLVTLSGSSSGTINIEGLAVTPEGGLLFGFRNLVDNKAPVVSLKNPDAVLAGKGNVAEFGETAKLDLGGRGIRSLERIGNRYLIVAGKPNDSSDVGYALYWWDGASGPPVAWDQQPNLVGTNPEVAMRLPDGTAIQMISDDGDRCAKVEEEDPPLDTRGFSSLDVPL